MKQCTKCRKDKPNTDFHRDNTKKSGLGPRCKLCKNSASANRRLRNSKSPTSLVRSREQAERVQTNKTHKVCTSCGKIKPLKDYHKMQSGLLGRKASCKICVRHKAQQSRYGITEQQYNELLKSQNNSCALCSTQEPGGKGCFHIDHDHQTGEVRGLLCHQCNTGLGLFKDNPDTLQKAIHYLNRKVQV